MLAAALRKKKECLSRLPLPSKWCGQRRGPATENSGRDIAWPYGLTGSVSLVAGNVIKLSLDRQDGPAGVGAFKRRRAAPPYRSTGPAGVCLRTAGRHLSPRAQLTRWTDRLRGEFDPRGPTRTMYCRAALLGLRRNTLAEDTAGYKPAVRGFAAHLSTFSEPVL